MTDTFVDDGALEAAVRAALRSPRFQVQRRTVRPIGGTLTNPATRGLYRITGSGADPGGPRRWSLVLKEIQEPAPVGGVDLGSDADPRHWNYWRREGLVYQSSLLEDLPDGLAAPRFYGVDSPTPGRLRLWLEDIRADGRPWPFDRCIRAAELLGHFNGSYLAGRPLPQVAWLAGDLLRQWARGIPRLAASLYDPAMSDLWRHPLVVAEIPPAHQLPLRRLLAAREQAADALDTLPQTLCHRDATPGKNLLTRPGEATIVALDWALCGIGPVGEDLAQLVAEAIDMFPSLPVEAVDRRLFRAYIRGLRAAGWSGDERLARAGYTLGYALRQGLYRTFLLSGALVRADGATATITPDRAAQRRSQALARVAGEALMRLTTFPGATFHPPAAAER